MPRVKKHTKLFSDGDKIQLSKSIMDTSITSSNVSSSSSSLPGLKKSHSTNNKSSFFASFKSSNNNDVNSDSSQIGNESNQNEINRPRSNSIISKTSLNASNSLVTSSLIETPTSAEISKNASKKRGVNKRTNRKFHQLFPSVSLSETVIDTYSCAYVKSLNLLHGVMFLTKNYVCFYSKILSAENILIIKLQHINSIKKTMHALIFPTAIRIETQNSGYNFTSFRSRSNTFDHLLKLLDNYQKKLASQSFKSIQSNDQFMNDMNKERNNLLTSPVQSDLGSEEDELDEEDKEQDLTSELLSITDEDSNVDRNNNKNNAYNLNTPVTTYFNNFIAYDQYIKNNKNNLNEISKTSVPFIGSNYHNYYDIDYSDLSNRKVTVSLRHKKTLIQKVKILISLLIPAFFDISRIDSLLPICFLMCILLLLNAFVLLNKVSKVDELFADLLIHTDTVIS